MGESLPGFKTPVPITFHSKRDAVPPNSVTLVSLAWSFLCSASRVAVPAMTLASRSDTSVRDVTVKSKVAEIPPVQLFTKTSLL